MKRILSKLLVSGPRFSETTKTFQKNQKLFFIDTSFNLQNLHNYSQEASETPPPLKGDVLMKYSNGLPVINILLPSRLEACQFTLRPITSNVGDFIQDLKNEDKGIDRAHLYTTDGKRIAASTQIGTLLHDNFVLMINDQRFKVVPPSLDGIPSSSESIDKLATAKSLISTLYSRLNIEEHQVKNQENLKNKLESLKAEILPLQKIRDQCEHRAVLRTKLSLVGGMVAMAAQYGVLARLTWWEYSWDIMEPVTYFITAGYAIAGYGYFLLTQQEYIYPAARDRVYLRFFYKQAKKQNFNVEKYNELVKEIERTEASLRRLRDPLELHLPIEPPTGHDAVIPSKWKKGEL